MSDKYGGNNQPYPMNWRFWAIARLFAVLTLGACGSNDSNLSNGEGGAGALGGFAGFGGQDDRTNPPSALDQSLVLPGSPAATTCTSNGQCASGFCVDGYCCDSACNNTCMACSAAKKGNGVDGVCGSIAYDTDPDNECANGSCSGGNTCKFYNGVACSSTAQCLSNYCVDDVCCGNFCMGECQTCSAAKKGSGVNGVCGNIVANSDPDNECNPGECNGSGTCNATPQQLAANGSACASGAQCSSGYCADGVCCDSWCLGACQACTAAKKGSGTNGTCGPISNDQDPDEECWGGACDGKNACKQYNGVPCANDTQCLSNYCIDGVCCNSTCNPFCQACSAAKKGQGNDGVCGSILNGQDPDNECKPGECNGSGACNQTQTQELNGVSCTHGAQCVSGYCVDGVCCGNVCVGACSACSAAKKGQGFDGSCGLIANGNDPDNECNPGECNGSGSCNQQQSGLSLGAACSLGTQCSSGYCRDGYCCDQACSGTCEACSTAKKGSGANGTCGAIPYDADPDNECAAGACSGVNTCRYYNGVACSATNDCLSGYCVDGFCCGNACETKCRSCSAAKKGAGANGVCGNIVNGLDPDNECALACGGSATCQPAPNGSTCTSGSDCGSGHCVDGFCCDSACTGTCQACSAAKKSNGPDGTCGLIANSSDPDDECPLGKCDGNGVCTQLSPNGTQCNNDAQCGSDHCVDGVCCDTACTGMCLACQLPSSVGTCSPIPVGQDDSTNAPPCLDICDGNGACVKNTGTSCTSGVECLSHICNAYVCEAPKPSNGPLEWMTVAVIPNGWAGPYPLLKLENMVATDGGATIKGDTRDYDQYPAVLRGYFSTNGYASLSKWNGMYMNWPNTFWEYIVKSGRGSATRWYQKTGLQKCAGNWGDGYSNLIAGNALGETVHIAQSCDSFGDGTNFGDGIPQYGPVFVRKRSGYPNQISGTPANITSPMAYGPTGEVYSIGVSGGLSIYKSPWGGGATTLKSVAGSVGSRAFSVDAAGNLLITFGFSGNINFGAGVLPGSGSRLGVVKLDPSGNVVWQKTYAGSVNVESLFLAGDVGFVIKGTGLVNLGYGSTAGNTFGIRFDANGTALFHVDLTHSSGLSDEQGGGVLVVDGNGSGDMYVGSTSWSTNWGWGAPMNGKYAITVAKYHQCSGANGCKNLGAVCGSNTECGSGSCVDDVCCNDACTGTCAACTAAKKGFGTDGICQNIGVNQDPEDECANGACNGSGKCAATDGTTCSTNADCASLFCVDGVCCNNACTGPCQACSAALKGSGIDGQCGPTPGGVDPEGNCGNGTCSGNGACTGASNGSACTSGNECASGFCADGVCCDSACSGSCVACTAAIRNTVTPNGVCGPIAPNNDPQNECTIGDCNGAGACIYELGESCSDNGQCKSGFCVDGVCCNSACTGECYACSAAKKGSGSNGSCGTIAAGLNPDGECPGPLACNGLGACFLPLGGACDQTTDCASGYCRDFVCCDSGCSGTCQACTASEKGSGSDGICGPIAAGTDPLNECIGSTCNGGGACAAIPCVTGADCPTHICTNGTCTGTIVQISTREPNSCVLFHDGKVKCWGRGGRIGLGDNINRGDKPNTMGANLPFVDFGNGRSVVEIVRGFEMGCVRFNNGTVACFGANNNGSLGRGDNVTPVGDGPGEMGDALIPVNLGTGKTAVQIAAGSYHVCALLNDGNLKCWGSNSFGQLGQGDTMNRGSTAATMGDDLLNINLGTGKTAVSVSAGYDQTCAILNDATLKCWGKNDVGQSGTGNTTNHGASGGTMGDNLPVVNLGTGKTPVQISVGYDHNCAILNDGTLKCWGANQRAQLGLGDAVYRGGTPQSMGDNLPSVALGTGRTVMQVSAGIQNTCVLLDNGSVKCWGNEQYGNLGIGVQDGVNIGDSPSEMGDNLPMVNLGTGKTAVQIDNRSYHACALLNDGTLKCWGGNYYGALGLGDTNSRGTLSSHMGDNLPAVQLY